MFVWARQWTGYVLCNQWASISNINTLNSVYYTYFYYVIKYWIILWGNSSKSGKVFTLQKKIVRIVAGAQPRTSCTSLFKQLEILPVPCQYMLLLMNFVINNQEIFQTNSSIHDISTRNRHHLHRPNANLSCFQKSTFCAGIKFFNSLPPNVTILKNDNSKFKETLTKCIYTHSLYSVDEFFMCKVNL